MVRKFNVCAFNRMRINTVIDRIGCKGQQSDVSGNIFNKLIPNFEMLMRAGRMWADSGHYHSFVTHINVIFRLLYLTFKLTAYVFLLQYDFVRILGLLKPKTKPVRRKIMDILKYL